MTLESGCPLIFAPHILRHVRQGRHVQINLSSRMSLASYGSFPKMKFAQPFKYQRVTETSPAVSLFNPVFHDMQKISSFAHRCGVTSRNEL